MNIDLYLDCIAEDEKRTPIANEPGDGDECFRFYFGAYGETKLDVFADHLEDALEIAFEWLDDNAPGHLVQLGKAEWKEAAEELGLDPESDDDEIQDRIREHAETDLTVCGHTQLKNGHAILSFEWGVNELHPPAKLKAVTR